MGWVRFKRKSGSILLDIPHASALMVKVISIPEEIAFGVYTLNLPLSPGPILSGKIPSFFPQGSSEDIKCKVWSVSLTIVTEHVHFGICMYLLYHYDTCILRHLYLLVTCIFMYAAVIFSPLARHSEMIAAHFLKLYCLSASFELMLMNLLLLYKLPNLCKLENFVNYHYLKF